MKLDAGGKPSTWLPPGRLVEHPTNFDSGQKMTAMMFHQTSLVVKCNIWRINQLPKQSSEIHYFKLKTHPAAPRAARKFEEKILRWAPRHLSGNEPANKQTSKQTNKWTHNRTNQRTNEWNEQKSEQTNGRTNERTNERNQPTKSSKTRPSKQERE